MGKSKVEQTTLGEKAVEGTMSSFIDAFREDLERIQKINEGNIEEVLGIKSPDENTEKNDNDDKTKEEVNEPKESDNMKVTEKNNNIKLDDLDDAVLEQILEDYGEEIAEQLNSGTEEIKLDIPITKLNQYIEMADNVEMEEENSEPKNEGTDESSDE